MNERDKRALDALSGRETGLALIALVAAHVLAALVAILVTLVLLTWPAHAHAGFFDFIGDVGAAAAEATWKVALIRAVERLAPTILLLTCIVGAVGSAWSAAYLAMRWLDNAREAMRDDKVTVGEWIILGVGGLMVLPIASGLVWFAAFLMQAAHSGLSELMG